MKAISLWQPWASAIAMGLKRIETRNWATRHRGPLAIHAAKRWDTKQQDFADTMGMPELPFGKVVAIVNLLGVFDLDILGMMVSENERIWGDYSPGRFGWFFTDIRRIKPFEFRGGQGLFNVPDNLL